MKIRELFTKYHTGKLDHSSIHELERQGLDDPFTGDALEGIHLYQKTNLDDKLKNIEGRLDLKDKKKSKGTIWHLWPYAAAASFALLIVVTSIVRNRLGPTTDTNMTAVEVDDLTGDKKDALTDKAIESGLDDLRETLDEFTGTQKNEIVEEEALAVDEPGKPLFKDRPISKSKEVARPSNEVATKEDLPLDAIDDIAENTPSLKSAAALDQEQTAGDNIARVSPRRAPVTAEDINRYVVPSALKAPVDTMGGYPLIGFEKLTQMNDEWKKDVRTEFFMRGSDPGGKAKVVFELDLDGMPINGSVVPSMGEFLDNLILDFIASTGKWAVTDTTGKISHIVYY